MTCIFSYYHTVSVPELKLRPWWKFWAHDTLCVKEIIQRRTIELDDAEGKLLADMDNWHTPTMRLTKKLMGKNPFGVQLEQGHFASQYISTAQSGFYAASGQEPIPAAHQRKVRNLMKYSEPDQERQI